MASRKDLLKDLFLIALDLPNVENLPLQYTPMEIAYSRTANIADINIVGRNDNLHHYVSGSTSLDFSVDFYSVEEGRTDVKKKIKWLESMTYAEGESPPSRLKIVFGDLFKDEIWILRSVNANYSLFQPADNFMPVACVVALSFVRDTQINLTSSEIRDQIY